MTTRGPTLTEREFQAQVVQLARLFGWRCYHTHDSRHSAAGFPDLALCRVGASAQLLFLELKVGRRKPTPDQDAWLGHLRAAGVHAYVVRPSQWDDLESVLMGGADPGCLGGGGG